MKKLTALVLTLVLLCALNTFGLAEEERPVVTALFGVSQLPAENNSILTELCDRLNIDFRPTVVENTAVSEKFNTLAAAGMLPDIISFGGYTQTKDLLDNGVLLPLDDLLAEYGQDIIASRSFLMTDDLIARADGKLYGIPTSSQRIASLMVRQDWLDKLGLPVPTTIDEFYDTLKAFTFDDPDGDGQDDTIGYAATMSFITTMYCVFGAYGVPYGNPAMVDDQVVPFFMHPGYIEGVKFLRTMYQEGLMEPDFATIPNMSCLEKLWNGTYGFYFGDPIGTTNNWYPGRYTENPAPVMTYTYIAGPDGFAGSVAPANDSFVGINAKAKNPEACMKLLNYVCTEEGNMLTFAGIQGKHWDYDETGKFHYLAPYDVASEQRNDGGYCYFPVLMFDGMERRMLNDTTRYGMDVASAHTVPDAYIYTKPEIDANITFDSAEMLASLIVSTGDFEAEYAAYIQDYLANGGETWIEQATEIYEIENN